MDLSEILKKLKNNELTIKEAEEKIKLTTYKQLSDYARLDIHRQARVGIIEAILGDCKTCDQVVGIAKEFVKSEKRAIITRLPDEYYTELKKMADENDFKIRYYPRAKIVVIGDEAEKTGGKVSVVSAGTSDIQVAEEAKIIAQEMGCHVNTVYDVGVAGIHRLFPDLPKLMDSDSIVAVAGREGTLPSIIAGLVDVPVIGVPVSVGYGMGGNGKAALYSMLQSCSVLAVVNIDAGFVAGAVAARIANLVAKNKINI